MIDTFHFQGKRYGYTSKGHYRCEFCQLRATWNAVTKEDSRYTFVCDNHFLQHCQQVTKGSTKAARFQDPLPGEQYTLATIGEFLQGAEELKAIYSSRGKPDLAD